MKPKKLERGDPTPAGMHKVHIEYYMAYPIAAAPKKRAPSKKNVTVRKKKKKAAPSKKFDIDFGKNKGF